MCADVACSVSGEYASDVVATQTAQTEKRQDLEKNHRLATKRAEQEMAEIRFLNNQLNHKVGESSWGDG